MTEQGLVRRTITVLRAVAAHPGGVGLSSVARAAGLPKSTCYRVLSVLEQENWVSLDPVTRRYQVSLGLLSVVGGLLDENGSYPRMRAVVTELAAEAEETAGFDVLLPPHVQVVTQAAGPHLIGQTTRAVPRTQPVWCTSTGKVLLAALEPRAVTDTYGPELERSAPGGTAFLPGFLATLREVRDAGYAHTADEIAPGAASVAAPVRVAGRVPYAVWVGGPTFRFTPERLPALIARVRAAADEIGRLLSATDLAGAP
ncbi:IclR family transcriptional regulator [Streptomyces johnsoniae]|uniref:IclR family transcriptional regulator n=1 Tax=Streptomyces johnsoniae TaxID=3075532 RepID=A0ABU2S1X8_9ACTN|nr:IclR family transcriptional regulator [Streptomyces sp. DSM 41886]MDT0442444.1 IclR family transcriptional regulator [Streptomyces sp. DSM 41886]